MHRKQAAAAVAESPATSSPAEATLGEGLPTPPSHGSQAFSEPPAHRRDSPIWAMLIKRMYEIAPLACPECGGVMKVVAFIEPPPGDVIEQILRHGGLLHASSPRAPPARILRLYDTDGDPGRPAASDDPRELTFVDEATFWAPR